MNTASWVIVRHGRALFETANPALADAINRDHYEVLTAEEWLQRCNRTIKSGANIPDCHVSA